ncbi:MAG TPA: ATP-grasp domain-containing protein [Polyangiales bacterium]|nr:ATP-grasp domain-containing protein [Polyangiales bacterium]
MRRLKIGLAYNLRRVAVAEGDSEAEFDSAATIEALAHAIGVSGHDVVPCEADRTLPRVLSELAPDLVFNVSEGLAGLNREAQVPALCEMLGIEHTGSDAACMAISLNKATAKRLVASEGIRTPAFAVLRDGTEPVSLSYPAIVKPIAEGSSKGILEKQVVENERELRAVARVLLQRYRQPVLAEAFLPGREFTVALLGERDPRVLPIMEIVFTDQDERFPIYSFKSKFESVGVENKVPCQVTPALYEELSRVAKASFAALGCRDIARVDLRLDAHGDVHFIEANPLPGMSPNFSDLCVMANAEHTPYEKLVGEILAPGLRRALKSAG